MDTTASVIENFAGDFHKHPSEILGLLLEKEIGGKKFYKRINPSDSLPSDYREWGVVVLVRGKWKVLPKVDARPTP